MDRFTGKKDREKSGKLILILVSCIFLTLFLGGIPAYGTTKQINKKEETIKLEKEEIYGTLERPGVIFPVRWKSPEVIHERSYPLQRSFTEEIFEPLDLIRLMEGSDIQGNKDSSKK